MSNHLTSRLGHITATVALILAAALTITITPAFAATSESCPNEALRAESDVNSATGEPYSQSLAECRAYEMVSPPEKNGSSVTVGFGGLPVAPSGEAVGFNSQNAFGNAENYQAGALGDPVNPYVAHRSASGWVTSSVLAPRALSLAPLEETTFDGDATPNLSEFAECGNEIRSNFEDFANGICAVGEWDGAWNGFAFPSTTGVYTGKPMAYVGASRNLTTGVFESLAGDPFLPNDTSEVAHGDGLYEIVGLGQVSPQLHLVNVNNAGVEIGPAVGARVGGIGAGGPVSCQTIGSEADASSSYQAVSESGETIYFTACPGNKEGDANEIYARIGASRTVDVSDPAEEGAGECTTCSATAASAAFEGASANGSKAFFITTQQLLNTDTDTTMDLYEYDFDKPARENLVQLSYGSGEAGTTQGHGAEVQGVIRTASDGSIVYFVARGILTKKPNGLMQSAISGADNLYAADTETGETKFVAELCSNAETSGVVADAACSASLTNSAPVGSGYPLPNNDSQLWTTDERRPAQTTLSGNYLVFATFAKLITTGAEADTAGTRQIYRYDFATGGLVRVSVGEPSWPASQNGNTAGMNATIAPLRAGGQLGGEGALANINDDARAISEDGRTIVFATPQQLQANDVNTGADPSCEAATTEAEETGCDVYLWHECETGACKDGMAGEVGMISPGDDPKSSDTKLGAAAISASGADVFFFTSMPLVGQDKDSLVDLYDARIDGGFAAPPLETSCTGEACQGSPSASPVFQAPSTASFTGAGNVEPPPVSEEGKETAKSSGKVKITKHTVTTSTITLTVKAPSKGKLTASGVGLKKATKTVKGATSYKLKVKLTKAEQKKLKAKKKPTVKVKVAFKPASGKSSSASVKVKLER